MKISLEMLEHARACNKPILPITPLTHSAALSELAGRELFLKWDNKFRTGSFKERGACNFIQQLNAPDRQRGVCAASAGNHAMALSFHAARVGIPCTIVMPVSAPVVKVKSTEDFGAKVILAGSTFNDAYEHALKIAKEKNFVYVPAFDHPLIISGQGTCGLELLDQLPEIDSVVVPIGGGGLICGIAAALKAKKPDLFVLGVHSEWAVKSRDGTLPPGDLTPRSIADGIAVKREGEITKPLMQELVDQIVVVNEQALCEATVRMIELEKSVVEGAGAAGLAGLLATKLPTRCKKTAIVVTGSNIDTNVLARLIQQNLAREDRLMRVTVAVPDRPGMLHKAVDAVALSGGNILDVIHNRYFTAMPGNVDITFLVEVRGKHHQEEVLKALLATGVEVIYN